MRKTAVAAAVALVTLSGASTAGTPLVAITEATENRLAPIAATYPPLSEPEIGQRCQGFFRAVQVRLQLAQSIGLRNIDVFSFLGDLPLNRFAQDDQGVSSVYLSSYMVEFGPLNPPKTARSGLFNADRKTCTEFLDAMG